MSDQERESVRSADLILFLLLIFFFFFFWSGGEKGGAPAKRAFGEGREAKAPQPRSGRAGARWPAFLGTLLG